MSELHIVRTNSHPRRYGMGVPVEVFAADYMLEMLVDSRFMREHLKEMILEKMQAGREFVHRSTGFKEEFVGDPQVVTYRLAKPGEAMTMMASGQVASISSETSARRRRGGEGSRYEILKPDQENYEAALSNLTKQGRMILEVIFEADVREVTEASLEEILKGKHERVGVKADRSLVGLFKNHLKWTYDKFGLVRQIDEGDAPDGGEESDNRESEEGDAEA